MSVTGAAGNAKAASEEARPALDDGASPLGEELDVLIRARYPVIYIVSWEEPRVERHLRRIAESRGKQLYLWSVTSGMRRAGAAPWQKRESCSWTESDLVGDQISGMNHGMWFSPQPV